MGGALFACPRKDETLDDECDLPAVLWREPVELEPAQATTSA